MSIFENLGFIQQTFAKIPCLFPSGRNTILNLQWILYSFIKIFRRFSNPCAHFWKTTAQNPADTNQGPTKSEYIPVDQYRRPKKCLQKMKSYIFEMNLFVSKKKFCETLQNFTIDYLFNNKRGKKIFSFKPVMHVPKWSDTL